MGIRTPPPHIEIKVVCNHPLPHFLLQRLPANAHGGYTQALWYAGMSIPPAIQSSDHGGEKF